MFSLYTSLSDMVCLLFFQAWTKLHDQGPGHRQRLLQRTVIWGWLGVA